MWFVSDIKERSKNWSNTRHSAPVVDKILLEPPDTVESFIKSDVLKTIAAVSKIREQTIMEDVAVLSPTRWNFNIATPDQKERILNCIRRLVKWLEQRDGGGGAKVYWRKIPENRNDDFTWLLSFSNKDYRAALYVTQIGIKGANVIFFYYSYIWRSTVEYSSKRQF